MWVIASFFKVVMISGINKCRGCGGRDHMVVGFTTKPEPRSWRGVLDTTLCYKVCH
jgi:hypothetical protein